MGKSTISMAISNSYMDTRIFRCYRWPRVTCNARLRTGPSHSTRPVFKSYTAPCSWTSPLRTWPRCSGIWDWNAGECHQYYDMCMFFIYIYIYMFVYLCIYPWCLYLVSESVSYFCMFICICLCSYLFIYLVIGWSMYWFMYLLIYIYI